MEEGVMVTSYHSLFHVWFTEKLTVLRPDN